MVKNLPANSGDMGSIPLLGRSPGEGNGNPLQYTCLENPMKRILAGYSPWGCKRVRYDIETEYMPSIPCLFMEGRLVTWRLLFQL